MNKITKKIEKQMFEHYSKEAKKLDWDTLAYQIMMLENATTNYSASISKETLKGMSIKLEAYETNKRKRIEDGFDYKRYMENMTTNKREASLEDDDFSNI